MHRSYPVLRLGAAALVLLVAAAGVVAQDGPRPPKNLKKVGDHWTAWDSPTPGADDYIIVPGDTLWDLSTKWLGDPYLWPQIWDENRYVVDSHWIYPGDPLVIPGRPTVVPDSGPPPSVEMPPADSGVGEEPEDLSRTAPQPGQLLATRTDLYCSNYIDSAYPEIDLEVTGLFEEERTIAGAGDVIFLNRGRDAGLSAGDEFSVIRRGREIAHPIDGGRIGTYVSRIGRVRIMIAQADFSTAVVDMSCDEVVAGDELVEWQEIPLPEVDLPEFVRYDVDPSGGAEGYVIGGKDYLEAYGEGSIISTDLGELSGVRPGDVLTLYRDVVGMPRNNLGQAVILTTQPESSTARVLVSVREMLLGDRVEVVN